MKYILYKAKEKGRMRMNRGYKDRGLRTNKDPCIKDLGLKGQSVIKDFSLKGQVSGPQQKDHQAQGQHCYNLRHLDPQRGLSQIFDKTWAKFEKRGCLLNLNQNTSLSEGVPLLNLVLKEK